MYKIFNQRISEYLVTNTSFFRNYYEQTNYNLIINTLIIMRKAGFLNYFSGMSSSVNFAAPLLATAFGYTHPIFGT